MSSAATPIADSELEALFAPLADHAAIGLAVSGGPDSSALMHLAARWRARRAQAPELCVLTVDHGLRPESAGEARTVAEAAARLGLPAAILRWQGRKPASGLQAAARAARYDLLAAHAHAHGLSGLATAHHLDDQAETLLMRLARGSGVDGLAAMPTLTHWAGVAILRPLLDVPKARLIATLQAAGVVWLEDPSNADARFERVRMRKLLAAAAPLGLDAKALALTARRMRRARAALDRITDRFLADHVAVGEAGWCSLARAALREAPEEIALRALARMLLAVGGGPDLPQLARLEALLGELASDGVAGRTLAGCRILCRAEEVIVLREGGRRGLPRIELAPGGSTLWDRRFRVSAAGDIEGPLTVRALGREGLRAAKARLQALPPLPPSGGAELVSVWRAGKLLAVPHLGLCETESGAAVTAEFVNAGLLGRAAPATPRPAAGYP